LNQPFKDLLGLYHNQTSQKMNGESSQQNICSMIRLSKEGRKIGNKLVFPIINAEQ